MSILVIVVVWGAMAGIIACFFTRKKKVRIGIIISLPIAAIALCFALRLYFSPMQIELPEDYAFSMLSYGSYFVEDEEKSDAIAQLLGTLEIQRELKIEPVTRPMFQVGKYFVVEVLDMSQAGEGDGNPVAYLYFFIQTPEASYYEPFGGGRKYTIIGAESITDELYELVKSSKPSIDE